MNRGLAGNVFVFRANPGSGSMSSLRNSTLPLASPGSRSGCAGFYNHKRPHQGFEGLCPADRFFEIQSELRKTLGTGIQDNVLEMALRGQPGRPSTLQSQNGFIRVYSHPFAVGISAIGLRLRLVRSQNAIRPAFLNARFLENGSADPGPCYPVLPFFLCAHRAVVSRRPWNGVPSVSLPPLSII